jgi:hypothetical protein
VICKYGRTKPTRDQQGQLYAESAGTCLLCSALLFKKRVDGSSLSIAERAHIVAHSEKGPRGDVEMSGSARNDPANLVLLCPTCHTTVDKDPAAYPAERLLAKKRTRAAAVARIGGVPIFASRSDARGAVEAILDRNETIFRLTGPNPRHGSLPSTEAAAQWRERVLEDIVQGNELIVAIVELNPDLTTKPDRVAAEQLRLHTEGLARKHRCGEIVAPVPRFPQVAIDIFAGDL